MREHTYLPAMVGFVSNHVAQHLRANRPGLGPAVSAKRLDAAPATERVGEHVRAAGGALRQSRAGLLRRAVRAVELRRDLQVRRCKPDPLAADVVHVREDRRNGADVARRFGFPRSRVKVLNEELVHVIVGGKDSNRGSAWSAHMKLSSEIGDEDMFEKKSPYPVAVGVVSTFSPSFFSSFTSVADDVATSGSFAPFSTSQSTQS
jgi:hypothetical protein